MLLCRTNYSFSLSKCYLRTFATSALPNNSNDYSAEAIYPEIKDLSFKSKKKEKQQLWHEKIKQLKTVEEKLLEVNMPKYYGYKCTMLNQEKIAYNNLPLIQNCTSTVFHETDNLPDLYKLNETPIDSFVDSIKSDFENALLFELTEFK